MNRLEVLRQASAELGQSEVARRLQVSPSCVSQVLSGKYKANPEAILEKAWIAFGGEHVECPQLGRIELQRCADNRRRDFAATTPTRVRLYYACKACTVRRESKKGG